MALNPQQQALEQITRAKRILIVGKEHPTNDVLASAAACLLFFRAMGKQADAVIPGIDKKTAPSFLPANTDLSGTVPAMRATTISLNVIDVPLGELLYDVKDGKLEITVVPKRGEWTPQHLSFKHGDDRYDLVVALDAPDMQSLGELSRTQAEFLYRTTVLNIDCSAANEHWGQVNIVDLNAVSTSEILCGLFDTWNRNLINADIATALLAGMISKTKSFRTQNVTPKTLTTASQLIAMGARREEIVHGLWRTRSVATLKLWGRALSRLEQDRASGLVWAGLSTQDLVETGANISTLEDVIDELIAYAPEAKVIAFVTESERPSGLRVLVHANAPYSAAELTRQFGATGTRERASFTLKEELPLIEGMKTVIDRLKEQLAKTAKN
jgi:phosphoesterase RecJ-like protein